MRFIYFCWSPFWKNGPLRKWCFYLAPTCDYKVEVIKINTILSKPKIKVVRGKLGKKTGYKKAIVTLKEGQTIDMTSGV